MSPGAAVAVEERPAEESGRGGAPPESAAVAGKRDKRKSKAARQARKRNRGN